MKAIAWNCRGINDPISPKLPYVRWLLNLHKPNFLLLTETKTSVENVASMFWFSCPSCYFGVDYVGASGGLVVFCWTPFVVDCVFKSCNAVLLDVLEPSGNTWSVIFCYGSPVVEHRLEVWNNF